MGCSSGKDQSSTVVISNPKRSTATPSAVPASSSLPRQASVATRWSPSARISISNGTAKLKAGSPMWSTVWTNVRVPDALEVSFGGSDVEKIVLGVTAASNRSRADGTKQVKGCEWEVFSYEGVGLVHTQFSDYTYNSEQWKVRPGDVIRVEITAGVCVTFSKNSRKLYTHEDVPDVPLLAFLSLGSEQVSAELRS